MAVFSQVLCFGFLSSSIVSWMETQGAMKIRVRKDLWVELCPSLGNLLASLCQPNLE